MFKKFGLTLMVLGAAIHGPVALADPVAAAAAPRYSLTALRDLARTTHPSVQAARALIEAGRAQVVTAGAYPNPEIEFLSGRTRARTNGVATGAAQTLELTQRIDNPWQREARLGVASSGLEVRRADARSLELDLLTRLDQRFYELLRRQAELRATKEDLALAEQIRARVAVRVETGEAPRYELIKSDTELLNAQKNANSAALRLAQARAALRGLVGSLPAEFEVEGELSAPRAVPTLDELRAQAMARNPDLLRARAELARAERQLELERARRHPDVALRVVEDRDVEIRDSRYGVTLTIPLWDRRQGPVAEANALLMKSRNDLANQELLLLQSIESTYRQFEIAGAQVNALENGILRQAEAALKVAESAYRFGERGILDYLDAQRVFRAARNELIAARYELQLASIEIERLRALNIEEMK
ncbi:TolC family protein [Zoogloea sp.]|uniref:TolC family protein n=1 Tax=Zoogloea sp. TaxID=49181 RepID=UPI001AC05EE2|nr:TolC family protein [Zoogloea sp.]MBN8282855.1 TolC family protein [Zoogloea sp.]